MGESLKIEKWEIAVPVTVVNDEDGNPMWFHPPCGVGHPFVDGKAECPVYADAKRILAEAVELLKANHDEADA